MTKKEKQKLLSQITAIINALPVEEEFKILQSTKADKVELLTIKECVQEIKGLSECTLRQLIAQNKISYIRTGMGQRGKILVNKTSLLKYFEEQQ